MPAIEDQEPRNRRHWLSVGVFAALLVTFAWQAATYLQLPLPQQVREIPDDSFFYLQVARSFCDGNGFTFDGETPTYGFQPLWQLVVIGLCAVVGDGHALFVATFLLCAALHTGIAWALFRLASRCFGAAAGVVASALWIANPALFTWSAGLKENALYTLLLAIACERFVRNLQPPSGERATRRAVAFGLLLGLMVFTRVNAVIPVTAMLGAHVVAVGLGGGFGHRLRHVAIAAATAVLVAAPWYVFAQLHFGSAMPTSGSWKLLLMRAHVEHGWGTPWLSFDHVLAALRRWPDYLAMLFDSGYQTMRAPLFVGAVAWPVMALRRRLSPRRLPLWPPGGAPVAWILATLTGSAAIASFANQMMLPGYLDYARWYAVPEYLLVAVAGGGLLGTCWRRGDGRIALAALAALLALACWRWPPTQPSPRDDQREAFAELPQKTQLVELGLWARAHIPDGVGIGIWDPGIVAWFADRRLVSFDPLMNSLDYQQGDIADPVGYVKKRRIAYMIGIADRVGERYRYVPLPPNGYEIVWLPYPDRAIGFGPKGNERAVLVRPLASPVPAFLDEDDFPCGVLYPNDPARRRTSTRDRDRLLAGETSAADVVRLWLALPADGPALELRAGDAVVARFAPGTTGFRGVDVRAHRGAKLSVSYPGGDPTAVIEQAHLVDYRWPTK